MRAAAVLLSRTNFSQTNVTSQWRHRPQWISNFYIVRIRLSLGIVTAIFV